jgi:hypothetical protein
MDLLIGLIVILGITNLMVVVSIFVKLNSMDKKLTRLYKQVYKNKLHIEKMVKILDVLIKKTNTGSKINFN